VRRGTKVTIRSGKRRNNTKKIEPSVLLKRSWDAVRGQGLKTRGLGDREALLTLTYLHSLDVIEEILRKRADGLSSTESEGTVSSEIRFRTGGINGF